MEEKAQGSLEYLLIIGAAILVVAIVIIALTGVLGNTQGTADQSTRNLDDAIDDLNNPLD